MCFTFTLSSLSRCTSAGAAALAIYGVDSGWHCAHAHLLRHSGKPADCSACAKQSLCLSLLIFVIFVDTNIFTIGLFGILYYLLLQSESVPFLYVSSNGHDSGCCGTVKNNWSCTCRNAMALLESVQSIIYHALKLLLYYCTMEPVPIAVDIVSLTTI